MRATDYTTADTLTLLAYAKALAAPEPEPFYQVRPNAEDNKRWQHWHDHYNEALLAVRTIR